ncbi:MAG: tRNA-dependent cyclodipeptide synthase [Syntrophales bacterium]
MKQYSIRVSPSDQKKNLQRFNRCLYGVSVGVVNQHIEDILKGYRWASEKFKRCCILLGDSLYRFTLQIQKGVNLEESETLARDSGNQLLEEISLRLTSVPEVIRCSDVLKTMLFKEKQKEIYILNSTNDRFRDSIAKDALSFVERQARKGRLAILRRKALDLAIFYLIEEVAIYSCLADQGWLIDVYQGDELPTLAKIISGEIPGVEGSLTKRINISLHSR